MQWLANTIDGGHHVHVVPLDDQIVHEMNDEATCACGPAIHYVDRRDGSDAWLISHNSLDGRELTEQG